MSMQLAVAVVLHQLATLVWIGGMFFTHFALRRPLRDLATEDRLRLMLGVFRRFFSWVWLAVMLLWGTGVWIIVGLRGGDMELHVAAMIVLASIMTVLFAHLYLVPYQRFKRALASNDTASAAAPLDVIRRIVPINLFLGLITTALGSGGGYLL